MVAATELVHRVGANGPVWMGECTRPDSKERKVRVPTHESKQCPLRGRRMPGQLAHGFLPRLHPTPRHLRSCAQGPSRSEPNTAIPGFLTVELGTNERFDRRVPRSFQPARMGAGLEGDRRGERHPWVWISREAGERTPRHGVAEVVECPHDGEAVVRIGILAVSIQDGESI